MVFLREVFCVYKLLCFLGHVCGELPFYQSHFSLWNQNDTCMYLFPHLDF